MTVNFTPDGFHTVTPYLTVQGANQLLEFVKAAFDAEEVLCMKQPDGMIRHAAVKIGNWGSLHNPSKRYIPRRDT